MISVHFNFDVFMIGFVLYMFFCAFSLIIMGMMGTPKTQKHGAGDAIIGAGLLFFLIICLII